MALRRLEQFNKSGQLGSNRPTQRLRWRRGVVEIQYYDFMFIVDTRVLRVPGRPLQVTYNPYNQCV